MRVLYTGDFSREEDRHLCGAETPAETPHVLICEATYGVALHMKRELREQAMLPTPLAMLPTPVAILPTPPLACKLALGYRGVRCTP